MIELYTCPTPNGRKISVLLEELKVPYLVYAIDIDYNDQFSKKFSKISSPDKIPAIIDKEKIINF
jgi:GST-like protein